MSTGATPKQPTSSDGSKSDVVAAAASHRTLAPTPAATPMPPSSTPTVPRAIVSAAAGAQLRPTSTLHRPNLQDVAKSVFTGQLTTRSPFTGSGRLLAPAIATSSTGVSPFSASVIGLPTSSSATLQPIVAKPAIATQSTVAAIGPPASAVSMGLTCSTTTVAPMASIIRGVTHAHPALQAAYSSHVPRGAAAVASITTLKSAVATPIQRTSQMYAQGFASATTVGSHPPLQPRSSTLPTLRAAPPPISRTITSVFSSADGHRPQTLAAVSAGLPSAKLLIAAPRATGDATVRQVVHSSNVLPKTQPFHQQLHQLPEKGFYRPSYTPANILPIPCSQSPATSTSVKAVTVSHQGLPSSTTHLLPPQTQLVTHSIASSTTGAPMAGTAASVTGAAFIASSPSNVQSHAQYHPHLPKVIAQAVHTAPISQILPTGGGQIPVSAAKPAVTTSVVVTHSLPRPIVSTGTSIPVAKVYPQPLTVATRPVVTELAPHVQQPSEGIRMTSAPTATLFISPSQQRPPPGVAVSAVANIMGTVSASVVIAETKADRPAVQNTTTFATIPPGTTTYFYEPYHGLPGTAALTMHPFPGTTGTHPFAAMSAATLRAGLPMHGAPIRSAVSNSAPVNIGSAVIMSMSPNNRQPLGISSPMGQANVPVLVSDSFVSSSSVSSTSGTITSLGSLVGHLVPNIPGSPIHSTVNTTQAATPSSSPRPSILRKRTIDSANMSVRKNLMSSLPGSQPPSPQRDIVTSSNVIAAAVGTPTSSTSSSPKSMLGSTKEASQENVQSSEGNDSSCNGSNSSRVIVKREPMDAFDALNGKAMSNIISTGTEASPRKKPRKQQLTGNEMVEVHSTEGEEDFERDNRNSVKKEVIKEDEENIRWFSAQKRPPVAAMLNTYRHSWKSRNNHFLRYSDIKLKDERRPTIGDLANQKGVIQKANGWKVHHICAQIEDLTELETAVHSRLTDLLENMEKKAGTKESDDVDLNRANELVRGNLQRCKIIRDQMKDARQQILKVLDHKSRIVDIVTKYVSKPSSRKRDRNY